MYRRIYKPKPTKKMLKHIAQSLPFGLGGLAALLYQRWTLSAARTENGWALSHRMGTFEVPQTSGFAAMIEKIAGGENQTQFHLSADQEKVGTVVMQLRKRSDYTYTADPWSRDKVDLSAYAAAYIRSKDMPDEIYIGYDDVGSERTFHHPNHDLTWKIDIRLSDNGMWVFDYAPLNVKDEPFVAGIPQIIEYHLQKKGMLDVAREKGFSVKFSANPDADLRKDIVLEFLRHDSGGADYADQASGMEGWLCPVLCTFMGTPPSTIYVEIL